MAELRAVPDQPESEPDVYGHIEFFDGTKTHRLTIGVYYGGPVQSYVEDVLVVRSGRLIRHPYDAPRESTEEERAAVGWTW